MVVWAQGEPAPRSALRLAAGDAPLALDRDLFGLHDNSLSRAANAPRLVLDGDRVHLAGNPRSVKHPLVIAGATLRTFQHDVATSAYPWPVRPAELSSPGRAVTSPRRPSRTKPPALPPPASSTPATSAPPSSR